VIVNYGMMVSLVNIKNHVAEDMRKIDSEVDLLMS